MTTEPKKPSPLVEILSNAVLVLVFIALATTGSGLTCRLFLWSAGLR